MLIKMICRDYSGDFGGCIKIEVNGKEMVVYSDDASAICLEDGFVNYAASGPPNECEIKAEREYIGKPFAMYLHGEEREFGITLFNVESDYSEGNYLGFNLNDRNSPIWDGVEINYKDGKFI